MPQKLLKLKRNLLIIITINILLLQRLILQPLVFLMQDQITKTDCEVKLSSLNRKITANKSKNLLVENELEKLKSLDSSYFIGKSHFEEDGTQNYLVFQSINKYFKVIANTNYVSSWKSKGLSAENIMPPTPSSNSLTPALSYYGTKTRVKFNGSCLKH